MFGTKTDGNTDTRYGTAPSVLVASDSASGRMAVEDALSRLDTRLLAIVPLAEAEERLARTVSVSVVVVQADEGAPEDVLCNLVARLDAMAAEGASRAIVIVPPRMIDAVYARITHRDVDVLSEPDCADIVTALAMACAPRPLRLNDVSGVSDGNRLVQISEEIGRIARTLATLAENAPRQQRLEPADFALPPPMTADVASAAGARVRALIRARRTRDQFFRSELFADPAWDMLLDLMAARLEHKRVSVSSLCIAAAVPATTALRWIKSMTDEGMFVRRADNNDGRRIFIELSDRAAGAMSAYLDWLKVNPVAMV